MADLPKRTFTPEELAAERARVALEWQLPQRSPEPRRQESELCCTLYDIQCICRVTCPGCRCRCKGCTCGPLTIQPKRVA